MGIWTWFKQSQTPKKKKRARFEDSYIPVMGSPFVTANDPVGGAIVLGANVIGGIAHGIKRGLKHRKERKRREKLPTARVHRG